MMSKDCENITFYGKKMCKVRDFVGFYFFMIVESIEFYIREER